MRKETIQIQTTKSGSVSFSHLIVSLKNLVAYARCSTVVGYPGLPNVKAQMELGDAMLYETTENGILEVRATAIHSSAVEFTVTQVSPRLGFGAALATSDPNNLPFADDERLRINESIDNVKANLQESGKYMEGQLSLIYRKLDEIYDASGRLGRKDWVTYVAGSLTSLCISAAFSPDETRSFFGTVNSAFSWLFTNATVFLLGRGAV